jgi:hypothetical protein
MPDVALSDYLAFVFGEISRARDMSDRYTKEIALAYAKDDVLRHFAVPRFKLAKLELTMPVLVSRLEVSSLVRLQVSGDAFRGFMVTKISDLILQVRPGSKGVRTDGLEPLIDPFFAELAAEPAKVVAITQARWPAIAATALTRNEVSAEEQRWKPVPELVARAQAEIVASVQEKTTVSNAAIQKLLVTPETNAVKEGGGDTAVFTLHGELSEEGVLVRTVRDERSGVVSSVVELE